MPPLDQPVPFSDALKAILAKQVVPGEFTSADWRAVEAGIKRQAFFSAGNFYQDALEGLKGAVMELIAPSTEPGAALDMGQARIQMKALFERLGYDPDEEEGMDLSSDGRINLVLQTNRDMAEGAAHFLQGNDPSVVDAFPAWELI